MVPTQFSRPHEIIVSCETSSPVPMNLLSLRTRIHLAYLAVTEYVAGSCRTPSIVLVAHSSTREDGPSPSDLGSASTTVAIAVRLPIGPTAHCTHTQSFMPIAVSPVQVISTLRIWHSRIYSAPSECDNRLSLFLSFHFLILSQSDSNNLSWRKGNLYSPDPHVLPSTGHSISVSRSTSENSSAPRSSSSCCTCPIKGCRKSENANLNSVNGEALNLKCEVYEPSIKIAERTSAPCSISKWRLRSHFLARLSSI